MDLARHDITVDGVRLAIRTVGEGTPLVLLHGFPQNHRAWLPLVPELAKDHFCILPDLRGYGDSDAPPDSDDHQVYSKRRMALDLIGILDALDVSKTDVIGHDRGARVAYRFALDHPDRLDRLGIIEIVPTGDFWANWHADLAMKAYHWTFLAQPAPLPEKMIGADPRGYMSWTLESWVREGGLSVFAPEVLESYLSQAEDPAHLAAMCADYRAGATYDRQLDLADKDAGRQIANPLLFIWAQHGFPASTGDAPGVWRNWAPNLTDVAITSGHFAMEEAPIDVLNAIQGHFGP